LEFIRDAIKNHSTDRVILVNHMAPSVLSINERYKSDRVMNGAYFSDLSEFILDHPQIVMITHGHVHNPCDYMIGSTRVVCNPRGYEGFEPDSGWDPNLTIEL
jgi:Icc-related predicted phosphoesterase